MSHPFTPHFLQGHFDATFLAHNTPVFHTLIFTTKTFVIFSWAKYSSAKQAVAFRLERAVVDRFRLLDFAEGPRANALGAGDADLDLVESFGLRELVGEFGQFVHDLFP